jgi:hypothetical protein
VGSKLLIFKAVQVSFGKLKPLRSRSVLPEIQGCQIAANHSQPKTDDFGLNTDD